MQSMHLPSLLPVFPYLSINRPSYDERQALPELMRTSIGLGRPSSPGRSHPVSPLLHSRTAMQTGIISSSLLWTYLNPAHVSSAPQLVQHPVLGRIHALQVLDDTTRHDLLTPQVPIPGPGSHQKQTCLSCVGRKRQIGRNLASRELHVLWLATVQELN